MIYRLSAEIEKEIQPKTTPFDKKAAVYRLAKKNHRGRQTKSPRWQLFHMYVKGAIKNTENEKGTVYA